ncbi:MAG TPA: hypothetical protein VHQ87_04890 [Rhizobacter sp.]|nr:hypothetical protein [Rhizobacter sp.]
MRDKAPPVPAKKPPPADHEASSAGEEDPGASLDDPVLRDAMQGEARLSGRKAKPRPTGNAVAPKAPRK